MSTTSELDDLNQLIQQLGDICHEQYMGCQKVRETGNNDKDYDYCYTDEVVNMLARPECKAALLTLKKKWQLEILNDYEQIDAAFKTYRGSKNFGEFALDWLSGPAKGDQDEATR